MSTEELRGRLEKKDPVSYGLWSESNASTGTANIDLPTNITGALTEEQKIAYQTMYRIEEISSVLTQSTITVPKHFSRSASPPPIYDAEGKRTNTKEQRYRKSLDDERYRLVEIALKMIPFFEPPRDYVRPSKFQDKYYIPVEQYPSINFVGLLLGPRGNTLRQLQETSKCKIAIRGRGSVKEGKNANDLPKGATNMEDPLHCLIIADSEDKIQDGIKACQSVVIKAVTSPEGQNDLKRGQLRELAELNGTLREDNRPCTLCGLTGHMKYECPNKETIAQKIICNNCGEPGHITRDCPSSNSQYGAPPPPPSGNNYRNQPQQSDWNTPRIQGSRYGSNTVVDQRYQNTGGSNGRYQNTYDHNAATSNYQSRYKNDTEYNNQRYQNNGYSGSNISSGNRQLSYDDDKITATTRVSPPPPVSSNTTIALPNPLENVSIPQPPAPGLDTNLPPGMEPTYMLPPGLSDSNGPSNNNLPPGLSGPPGL